MSMIWYGTEWKCILAIAPVHMHEYIYISVYLLVTEFVLSLCGDTLFLTWSMYLF